MSRPMLRSLFGVVTDIAKIITAPVEIGLDLTRTVTKPVADVAEDLVEDVKDLVEDLTDGSGGGRC